jgi:hypothetical protein
VAKILTFQTNTDRKIASHPRVVVVKTDRGAVALRFPEAWWPFVVLPRTKFTNSSRIDA